MNDKSKNKGSGRLTRLGISLAYYVFDMGAILIYFLFYGLILSLDLTGIFEDFLLIPLTWIVYFVLFFLTFKPIYENTGERTLRTAFIHGGGIFTVLHIVFFILRAIAYTIYKSVKESYVIPNFTSEQIERGREFYNDISVLMFALIWGYLTLVFLPLIISAFVSWIRLSKNQQETLPIETSQTERN